MAPEFEHERRVQLFSIADVLLGIGLIVLPLVIGALGQRTAQSGVVVGVIVIALAATRFFWKRTTSISFCIVVLGAWTIMSPWVLGEESGDARTFGYVIIGMLLAGIEAYSLTSSSTQSNWRQKQAGRR